VLNLGSPTFLAPTHCRYSPNLLFVIDSYPEFAPETEKQASPGPETLDLAVQPPAVSLAALRSLVVDSVSALNSKRAYGRAVDN